MKRILLRGALAMAIALACLLAQPKRQPAGEADALKEVFRSPTPDTRISACENFMTEFPHTGYKATVLLLEAVSYSQKRDYEHTLAFGERALEADPKHYQAMLMLATTLAEHTKEFDLDREQKFAQVEGYAKTALELLKDAPKPEMRYIVTEDLVAQSPIVHDDQWAAAKKDLASQAHAALGVGAMARKNFDVAESELKLSVDIADKPDPKNMVQLGRVYGSEGKYEEAIAQFDKVIAMQGVSVRYRLIAQTERARAFQKKGEAKPSGGP